MHAIELSDLEKYRIDVRIWSMQST